MCAVIISSFLSDFEINCIVGYFSLLFHILVIYSSTKTIRLDLLMFSWFDNAYTTLHRAHASNFENRQNFVDVLKFCSGCCSRSCDTNNIHHQLSIHVPMTLIVSVIWTYAFITFAINHIG